MRYCLFKLSNLLIVARIRNGHWKIKWRTIYVTESKSKPRTHIVRDKWLWTPHDATEYKHFMYIKFKCFFKKERTKIICLTCCIFVSFIQTTLYNHHTQKSKLLPLNVINMGWAIKLKGFCWTISKRFCIVSLYLHFVCTQTHSKWLRFAFSSTHVVGTIHFSIKFSHSILNNIPQ